MNMKRRISGLSVLALGAMLSFGSVGAALAQGGQHAVTGEVNVGKGGQSSPAGKASPAATSTPGATSSAPAPGPPQNRTLKRNPFVPPSGQGAAIQAQLAAKAKAEKNKAGSKDKGKRPGPEVAGSPPPPPTPPPFTLAGIISGGGELKALLITGKGSTEARVGDTVDGFKVTSINLHTREVVVQMGDHAFKVQLPQDSPYGMGKAPSGAPSAAPAASGPLPPPPAPAPAGAHKGKAHPKGGQ